MWTGIGNALSATVGEAATRGICSKGDAQGSLSLGTDQAVVSPGTLQVEVNMTMYGSCLQLMHPTDICEAPSVCQTLSPTLRIQSSTASFTGLHPGWGNSLIK